MPLTAAQREQVRRQLRRVNRRRGAKWTAFDPRQIERNLAAQLSALIVPPLFTEYRRALAPMAGDAAAFDADVSPDKIREITHNFTESHAARWQEALELWASRSNNETKTLFLHNCAKLLGVDVSSVLRDQRTQALVDRSVSRAGRLIKTIPAEAQTRVIRAMREVIRGEAPEGFSLREQLSTIEGITDRRAQLIARDQTAKLVTKIDEVRQRDVGVTQYTWRTSHDERVRPSHEDNDGQVFSWDAPPPETGHPGEDINCRCTAEPDLSGILGE